MDITTIILAVTTLLSGGGFFTLLADKFFSRQTIKAELNKVLEEARAIKMSNDSALLEQLSTGSKTMKDLIRDAEVSMKRNLDLSNEIQSTTAEKLMMQRTIDGQNFVIEDHKKARQEWLEMLERTLTAAAERKTEIDTLKKIQQEHTAKIKEYEERERKFAEVEQKFIQIADAFDKQYRSILEVFKQNKLKLPEDIITHTESLLEDLHVQIAKISY